VDGDGLMLVVRPTGKKSWLLRYQMNGVRRDMGLGSYPEIGLKEARQRTAAARRMIEGGADPIVARQAGQRATRPIPTFGEIAALVIANAQARTTNEKVKYQWERHLGPAYCGPLLDRPVNEITTIEVAAVLRPIWRTKPEVARKTYPAIRRVFDRARVILRDEHGVTMNRNPAEWSDLKALGFEAPRQLSRGRHPSLPYDQMADFMADLRARDAVSAKALEFLILTNVRTDAALKARWDQFDLEAAVWTIPLSSLKDREHRTEPFRVPLSSRAAEIVREMEKGRRSDFVFPSFGALRPLSNMAMLTLLKRMNLGARKWADKDGRSITAHGFRASFRTWAEEVATFPHAVIEQAMGHQVGSKVERAYRRTDLIEKRRELMSAWADYGEGKAVDNVLTFKRPG
jgi:integrase